MEKRFYTDDFEQFLKDTTDDFRMYPSRRVWNSLYNNLHPGRKWPSLTVCLLLVSSIIFIGISHTNEISGTIQTVNNKSSGLIVASQGTAVGIKENISNVATVTLLPSAIASGTNVRLIKRAVNKNSVRISRDHPGFTHKENTGNIPSYVNQHSEINSTAGILPELATVQISSIISKSVIAHPKDQPTITDKKTTAYSENILVDVTTNNSIAAVKSISEKNKVETKQPAPVIKGLATREDKDWIEDYAFHNQPVTPVKSKLAFEVYATPSSGYRKLVKNVEYHSVSAARPSPNGTTIVPVDYSLEQTPAFNLEAGYDLLYSYSKMIRLKIGIQLNYTNYNISAYDLGHSTMTTLVLNDPTGGIELSQRSSSLANYAGSTAKTKIKNNTFQVSLPIGGDIKIAGRHNLQWFLGATIQPTYVIFGNAYLISSDKKYYVYDASFLRKWNLNTGLESYLSYKAKNGVSFNAGPQFRYQLLSSYDKKYSYTEKLYNVGIKFGMTKNF